MRSRLRAILESAVRACVSKGLFKDQPIPGHVIEVPNNPEHGHFATNLPLAMARGQRRAPIDIAGIIAEHIKRGDDLLARVEVAAPGFINFWITPAQWHRVLAFIVSQGKDYGRSDLGLGQRVLVEFVSANPTGPLHLGHGRGAALGDTLCRILEFGGYDVTREFYINDAGQQIRLLGESIYSRYLQAFRPDHPFPEKGYRGD
jgi:arginyl-tRNA synthetase